MIAGDHVFVPSVGRIGRLEAVCPHLDRCVVKFPESERFRAFALSEVEYIAPGEEQVTTGADLASGVLCFY